MSVARVAGTDTREAMSTPTVRACVASAALAAGPGWAAAFGAPNAWRTHLAMPNGFAPWFAILLVLAGGAAALVASRMGPVAAPAARAPGTTATLPPGVMPAAIGVVVGLFAATQHDPKLVAMILPAVPLVAGWVIGQCARLSVSACVPNIVSAASGVVVAGAVVGLVFAGHLALVAKGSSPQRAAGWSVVYLTFSIVNLVRARRFLSDDLRVISGRIMGAHPVAEHGAERTPALSLEGIDVSFRSNRVLTGATLQTYAGELVALVGGNGAGKSTLLRVAAGLIVPDAGRVAVGADDVTTLFAEERAAAGLAFISGARPVFPDLTVVENLRVAAFRSHLTHRSFAHATEAVFELVPALAKRRKSKAGVLSGGEQRLLAVAQMLYQRPRVLLADELSLGLDVDARVAVLELLQVLSVEGVSAVVVDHDLPSLLPRATRALLLTAGSIEVYDNPSDLLTRRADLLPATFLAGANG